MSEIRWKPDPQPKSKLRATKDIEDSSRCRCGGLFMAFTGLRPGLDPILAQSCISGHSTLLKSGRWCDSCGAVIWDSDSPANPSNSSNPSLLRKSSIPAPTKKI